MRVQLVIRLRVRSGLGGGAGLTSYIWHSMDVRAEWPHFSALPSILLALFLAYIKGPTFLMYPGTCTCFSFRDFSRLFVLLVFSELTAIFV